MKGSQTSKIKDEFCICHLVRCYSYKCQCIYLTINSQQPIGENIRFQMTKKASIAKDTMIKRTKQHWNCPWLAFVDACQTNSPIRYTTRRMVSNLVLVPLQATHRPPMWDRPVISSFSRRLRVVCDFMRPTWVETIYASNTTIKRIYPNTQPSWDGLCFSLRGKKAIATLIFIFPPPT
jgi:hypothetical protein